MVEITYELQEKQLEMVNTEANEILAGGSAGSGKSYAMRVASIIWALEVPGLQVYLFRRQYRDLVLNHLYGDGGYHQLLSPLVDAGVCKIIGDEKIKFNNGSMIWLCHCQYEKDVYGYHGAEIHVLMIDELTTFSATQFKYLRNRVRIGGLKLPDEYKGFFPRIFTGSNPGNVGHAWVKAMFIDPAPPNTIWQTPDEEGGMRRVFLPSLLKDNKILVDNDPGYEKRLMGLGNPELVKAMLEGNWDIAQGAFFGSVWRTDKVIVPEFSLENTSWYKDRSYDWGLASPSAVCWFAESDGTPVNIPDQDDPLESKEFWMPKGSIVMFREWYAWNGTPNEGSGELAVQTAQRIKEIEAEMPFIVNPGPADNAIWNAQYSGGKIATDMEAEGITWTKSDKRAGSRIGGWTKIANMLNNACNEDPERPWLVFMDCCVNTIRTLPTLPRDPSKAEDIDTKSEDHLADAIRYRVGFDKPITKVTKFTGF